MILRVTKEHIFFEIDEVKDLQITYLIYDFDLKTGKCKEIWTLKSKERHTIDFLGKTIAIVDNVIVYIYDIYSKKCIQQYDMEHYVTQIQFSPSKLHLAICMTAKLVILGSEDKQVYNSYHFGPMFTNLVGLVKITR